MFDFSHALLRAPARSVVNGLRAGDHAGPAYDDVAAEHAAYADALRTLGLAVDVLPPLEAFPDSVFVEDPALAFGDGAILLRPGAPSRAGEVAEIAPALAERFPRVLSLAGGVADGGDVLATPDAVLIGLSARTDATGAAALAAALAELGRPARIVDTPAGVLHFKTACGLIDEETVAVTRALDDASIFGRLRRIVIPDEEAAAANLLRIRGHVLVGAAYPRTRELIEALGIPTIALPVAAIARIDAGLSCMSLRW